MLSLTSIGTAIAARRRSLNLTQSELAGRAGISRATLDALENSRASELGFSKIMRVLATLGLDLKIHEANQQRPTLEDLLEEEENNSDKGLGRRS